MQRSSTRIQALVAEMNQIWDVLTQISEDDLKAIIATGEGLDLVNDAAAVEDLRVQVRDWQYAVKNFADNFKGLGNLSSAAFTIAKRAIL